MLAHRWAATLLSSAFLAFATIPNLPATPPGTRIDSPIQAPAHSIKVTEISILPDGREASTVHYVDASALSFQPPSGNQAIADGDGSSVPGTPDPPGGDTPSGVSRVTYYQTGGGYERTTVYERDWIPSAGTWSAWRLISDHLSQCIPISKCFGVVTNPF